MNAAARPRRSLRYTDKYGRRRTLTAQQAIYLSDAWRCFDAGWGGLNSTLIVRLLEARGLITLWRNHDPKRHPRWSITGTTRLGDEVAARWRDDPSVPEAPKGWRP